MHVGLETLDFCTVVKPCGEIDAASSIQIQETIQKLIDEGSLYIHVDCCEIDYISSAGLGAFMSFVEVIDELGGKLVFSNMKPKVFDVFHILGLDQIMKIVKNREDAKTFLIN